VKLRVRGTQPFWAAAAAITPRIRLEAKTHIHSSFRTMAGVFLRTIAIPSAVLIARRSSSACHRHRYSSAISSLANVVGMRRVVRTSRMLVRNPCRLTRPRRARQGTRSGTC